MKILIFDENQTLGQNLNKSLEPLGYKTEILHDIDDVLSYSHSYDYDIILYDMKNNDMACHSFLHLLRSRGINTPVVVISNQHDVSLKVDTLNLGADDYLSKPFDIQELLARCKAIIRRSQGHSASAIQIGRLKIDLRRNLAEANGKILNLTNKEYAILELLAIRKGVMISKEMFLNHLYGGMDEPEIKIVDVFICRLRKKIADLTDGDNFIQTVWGRGYILQDPADTAVKSEEVMKAG